jgi:hypothetical protein
MLPPGGGRPLLISDAAVNIAPDVATRTEAALAMAALLRRMGVERPRIAVLSATESQLPGMPSSLEAAEIAAAPRMLTTGPPLPGRCLSIWRCHRNRLPSRAFTADSDSGAVAGYADGLIVPDIVSGNVLFKALAYCAGWSCCRRRSWRQSSDHADQPVRSGGGTTGITCTGGHCRTGGSLMTVEPKVDTNPHVSDEVRQTTVLHVRLSVRYQCASS